jgi:hypothetical protein
MIKIATVFMVLGIIGASGVAYATTLTNRTHAPSTQSPAARPALTNRTHTPTLTNRTPALTNRTHSPLVNDTRLPGAATSGATPQR